VFGGILVAAVVRFALVVRLLGLLHDLGLFDDVRLRLALDHDRLDNRLCLDDRLGLDSGLRRRRDDRRGRERHLCAPPRRLEPHRAAGMFALPGNGGLRLEPGNPDLPKLAQVARQRLRDAALRP
jgi:hypothetical protein